jgi:DDE domain
VIPTEVVNDAAQIYRRVLDELIPSARHLVERWANNRIEADRPVQAPATTDARGLRTDQTATVIITGFAFIQNLRRGHYELAVDLPRPFRVVAAFDVLARAI